MAENFLKVITETSHIYKKKKKKKNTFGKHPGEHSKYTQYICTVHIWPVQYIWPVQLKTPRVWLQINTNYTFYFFKMVFFFIVSEENIYSLTTSVSIRSLVKTLEDLYCPLTLLHRRSELPGCWVQEKQLSMFGSIQSIRALCHRSTCPQRGWRLVLWSSSLAIMRAKYHCISKTSHSKVKDWS